jgi:hypothetical protein
MAKASALQAPRFAVLSRHVLLPNCDRRKVRRSVSIGALTLRLASKLGAVTVDKRGQMPLPTAAIRDSAQEDDEEGEDDEEKDRRRSKRSVTPQSAMRSLFRCRHPTTTTT